MQLVALHIFEVSQLKKNIFLKHKHNNFSGDYAKDFPNPIDRKPGFLSRRMNRHATNASIETFDISSVQIVLVKFANLFISSFFMFQSYLNAEPSPFIYVHCWKCWFFFYFAGSISGHFFLDTSNFIGWTLCETPVVKRLFWHLSIPV